MLLTNNKQSSASFCLWNAIFLVLSIFMVTACSERSTEKEKPKTNKLSSGVIELAADSPKRAYIKTTRLVLSDRPLLQPIAGKVTLNESLTSRVSSPVAGRVVSSPVNLGTTIKQGATLLILDSPDVAAAEADYGKAQAALLLSFKAYERQKKLYEGKAISRKDFEQAQGDLTQAKSDAEKAKDRLNNLHIDPQQNDGRFKLRAPTSGIVLERHVNLGTEVRPDLPDPLYVISNIDKLSLLMEVFEVNIAKIKIGQHVLATLPAYPDERFSATVKYIGQELDESTRTVLVRCELPNPDRRLLPGMYATVDLQSGPDDRAIVIPLTAVFTEDASDYVFIALDNNRYQRRKVNLGLRLKDRAVVETGLEPDENLVSEGALMLRTEEAVEESSEQ